MYQVTVQATDEGGVAGRLPVTVTVEDVNEPPVVGGPKTISPESREPHGNARSHTPGDVPRHRPAQTTSWGPSSGSSTVLSGANSAAFAFDQSTGRLTFESSARTTRDGGGQYEVTLTANDGSREGMLGVTVTVANLDEFVSASAGGDTATQAVAVTITDKDEPAAVTASRGSGVTGTGSNLIVDENHSGTVATFAASDPENDATLTYTWSVAGTDRLDFSISTSGVLTFAATPDYERPADAAAPRNVYNITVSALDSDGKTGSTTVTVTVTNVNEPPVVGGPKTISWSENRT